MPIQSPPVGEGATHRTRPNRCASANNTSQSRSTIQLLLSTRGPSMTLSLGGSSAEHASVLLVTLLASRFAEEDRASSVRFCQRK